MTTEHSMNKKLKLHGEVESDSFDRLPDELVIFILEKLATCTKEKVFLENSKLLCRCSSLSKRFNALTCLIETLLIRHGDIRVLLYYCPKLLDKFKNIRSLQIIHWSRLEYELNRQKKPLPIIRWEAAYRPHGYCLAVLSYRNPVNYSDKSQKHQTLRLSSAAKDDNYFVPVRRHTFDMLQLHHMLVSSVKDHKFLQKVEVTDIMNRGMLTLDQDVLADLRNCASTNVEQVLTHNWCGSARTLDFPLAKPYSGVLVDNVCFNIVEWWENVSHDHVYKDDGINMRIPTALPFKCHQADLLRKALQGFMEKPEYVQVRDREPLVKFLSEIKSIGHIL